MHPPWHDKMCSSKNLLEKWKFQTGQAENVQNKTRVIAVIALCKQNKRSFIFRIRNNNEEYKYFYSRKKIIRSLTSSEKIFEKPCELKGNQSLTTMIFFVESRRSAETYMLKRGAIDKYFWIFTKLSMKSHESSVQFPSVTFQDPYSLIKSKSGSAPRFSILSSSMQESNMSNPFMTALFYK